jgi:hypothetical protein
MEIYVTKHSIVYVMQTYLQLQASRLSDSPSNYGLQHTEVGQYMCRYMLWSRVTEIVGGTGLY